MVFNCRLKVLRQKILTVLRNETSSCSDPPSASAIIGQVAYDEVSYKDNPILMLRVVDWPPVILVVCQSKVILLYYLFVFHYLLYPLLCYLEAFILYFRLYLFLSLFLFCL